MDANKLKVMIFEKSLNIDMATDLCKKVCCDDAITIGDAFKLKELLNLTDSEAIDIFLS